MVNLEIDVKEYYCIFVGLFLHLYSSFVDHQRWQNNKEFYYISLHCSFGAWTSTTKPEYLGSFKIFHRKIRTSNIYKNRYGNTIDWKYKTITSSLSKPWNEIDQSVFTADLGPENEEYWFEMQNYTGTSCAAKVNNSRNQFDVIYLIHFVLCKPNVK